MRNERSRRLYIHSFASFGHITNFLMTKTDRPSYEEKFFASSEVKCVRPSCEIMPPPLLISGCMLMNPEQ